MLPLLACAPESAPSSAGVDLSPLEDRIAALESDLAAAQADLTAAEAAIAALPAAYTDADAVAAVQNSDPWTNPDEAKLVNLWSQTDYGYQWLDSSRWTMDNRSDPAGAQPRHELIQLFHETPECTEASTFAECNATAAIKFYVNGPSVVDNDWSEAGYAKQAVKRYHTHTSGIYLVSFGQYGTVTDYAYGLIPPSGIHLEPWGAHQAIRVDGSQNAGDNIRIDTTLGATGLAIYESASPSPLCSVVRTDCDESWPLYIRGGTLHFEDVALERSLTDGRGAGPESVHTQSVGIEHFYAWHDDPGSGLPVHCTWNDRVTDASVVRVQAYGTSPDLRVAHSYAIVDVWGPGGAPAACTGIQLIRTNAAGVYGYAYSAATMGSGGFSVAILGPTETPLYPGDWDEVDRPSFVYEVIDAI